jgi:hypothetical protein
MTSRLSILPEVIITCKIIDYERSLRELLKLVHFSNRFISFTESGGEISLIADQISVEQFSSDVLVRGSKRWKAIQIYEGAHAINESGWVSRFSQPLAEKGIGMLYLSTYNTDLILVDEAHQIEALGILEKAHSQEESVTKLDNVKSTFLSVEPSDIKLKIISFSRIHIDKYSSILLHLFLDVDRSDSNFFSFLSSGEEISLIIPKFEKQFVEQDSLLSINAYTWRSILIFPGESGFEKSMVNSVARVLASYKVSLYYLSTCDQDFILVENSQMDKAVEILQNCI